MTLIGAVAAEFAGGLAFPSGGPAVVATAAAVFAAGVVLACWPHPDRNDALEALIEATREMTPRPMVTWTAADWAAREKELKELSEP